MKDLPFDIKLFITDFLLHDEKIRFGSCCKSFYQNLVLPPMRIFKRGKVPFFTSYYNDAKLQEKVSQVIKSPEQQLELTISMTIGLRHFPFTVMNSLSCSMTKFITDILPTIDIIYHLKLSNFILPSNPLSFRREKDGSFLPLKSLDMELKGSTVTLDLPPLPPTLQSLSLDGPYTNVANEIALLQNLQSLTLYRIDSLTDVSMLGNIPVITFKRCHNITDITPLQNNHTVRIEICVGIKDYRQSFTNTKNLTIELPIKEVLFDFQHCQQLQTLYVESRISIPSLQNISNTLKRLELFIKGEINLSILNPLTLVELSLQCTNDITSLELFGRIPILYLTTMNQITSLQGLGYDEDSSKNLRNRKVRIELLSNVKDFTPLNTIHTVIIENCTNLTDLTQVKDVKDLSLLYNSNFNMNPNAFNIELNAMKLTLGGACVALSLKNLTKLTEIDLSLVEMTLTPNYLLGLEDMIHLQRLLLPKVWEDTWKSAGWEILEQDYLIYDYDGDSVLYLRKNNIRV